MGSYWEVLIFEPGTYPYTIGTFFLSLLASMFFCAAAPQGFWLGTYTIVSVVLVVSFLLYVVWTVQVDALRSPLGFVFIPLTLLVTPLGFGWMSGLTLGLLWRKTVKAKARL